MRNYLWAPAMRVIREGIVLNTVFADKSFASDFVATMVATVQFHPFDYTSEWELQEALKRIPKRCNYRSCGGYRDWKDGKAAVTYALAYFIEDTNEIAAEYYSTPMNFAPGYKKPPPPTYKLDPDALAEKLFWPVHRAAHGLTK